MIIREYGNLPTTYAPDIGEVILARRNPADRFVRAVVLNVRRQRTGKLRIKLHWLESDQGAGVPRILSTGPRTPFVPIVAGEQGFITLDPANPQLIKQVDRA